MTKRKKAAKKAPRAKAAKPVEPQAEAPIAPPAPEPTPATAAEPVLVVRTCKPDLTSHGGFQWPASGPVAAPDWSPVAECGHGLHGLKWGEGDWSLMDWAPEAKGLIVEVVGQLVDIGGKVKFAAGVVRKVTSLAAALCEVLCAPERVTKLIAEIAAAAGPARVKAASSWLASSGDESRLASSGASSQLASSGASSQLASSGASSQLASSGAYSQLASSGAYSRLASSGASSQLASSGAYSQLASSGDESRLASSGDESRLASSGAYSIAMGAGTNSVAKAGPGGCVALAWFDGKRQRVVVGYVGEGLEADTWYRVENGKLVKA